MFGDQFRTVFSLDTNRRTGTLDLRLAAVLTVFAAVVLLVPVDEPTLLRALAGLPLVLFLPGYAVTSALFPASAERTPGQVASVRHSDDRVVSTVERIVISVVASVAIVGGAGIVANFVVGVTLLPILAVVVAVTLLASLLAYTQRLRLPESRRYAPLQSLTASNGPHLPGTATGWFLLVAALLSIVVVGASGVAALGPDGDGVTEFYVGGETENGTVAMGAQPTNLTAGVSATHLVVLEHRQPTAENYTVVARIESGSNGTGSPTEVGRYRLTVDESGTAVQAVELTVSGARDNPQVVYYLYEGSAPETPSRESALRYLRVNLDVSSGP